VTIKNSRKERLSKKEYARKWREKRGNREKLRRSQRKWAVAHPERNRRWYHQHKKYALRQARAARFRREFDISLKDYTKLLKKQKYCCWICKRKHYYKRYKRLRVDHNHKTGKYRGLLCDFCNLGLGRFNDDIKLLRRAIKYLQRRY